MSLLLPISYVSASVATAHASNARVFDGIWVFATAGNVASVTCTFQQGPSIQFSNIAAGTLLPFKTSLITAISGTGAGVIGLNGPSNPYCFNSAFVITPNDTASNIYDAIWIDAVSGGTRLDVVPRTASGTVTLTVAAGQIIPIRTQLVPAATTATVIGLRF